MAKSTGRAKTVSLERARITAEHLRMAEEWQSAENRFVLLCSRLHQTLDINSMLDIFADEVARMVPFASLSYRLKRSGGDFGYLLGSGGPHHCCYNLSLRGQELGCLRLDRRERFSEDELMLIEQFIGVLVQPLRNAWRYQEAMESAMTDGLTGLGNRRALDAALTRNVEQARRYNKPLSMLLCDLDHFKEINDTLGHAAGDEILMLVSERLQEHIRASDLGFRYGGEEFAVLLPQTDADCALKAAERLRRALNEAPMAYDDRNLDITASLGVATLTDDDSAESLLETADTALYEAKANGRNTVILGTGSD